jgi:hypothetical protein
MGHIINLQEEKESEMFFLKKIEDIEEKYFCIGDFTYINRNMAVYYLNDQDFSQARIHFSKAGIASEYMHVIYGGLRKVQGSSYNFMNALFSDNPITIERLSNLEHDKFPNGFALEFGKCIQAHIKDDMVSFEQSLANLAKITSKTGHKIYNGCTVGFEGILKKDINKIEEGIHLQLKTHRRIDGFKWLKDYICLHGTTIAKMAWRIGIEIEIDNPLIPKGLLPYAPLPFYEGYEFFKEIGY